jgi:endonuclease/exonuclease/phosphatase family metal-dependent hydrolase
MRSRVTGLAVAVTALATLVVPFAASSADARPGGSAPPGKPITVMTRNLYLGADIQRPLREVHGTGFGALVELGNSVHGLRQVVDDTNFNVRGRLLAREIATQKPDLVGLQEVALWRSGPLRLPDTTGQFPPPSAQHVDYDFLQILLDDLAADGVRYQAVSTQVESDVEAPSFTGTDLAQGQDVRLTMRDAIIKRADNGVKVLDEGSGQYAARLSVSVAGAPFPFIRGYNWVDVRSGSGTLRFVNTHLEAFSSYAALAQAHELLAGPAGDTSRTTVIVCDCNSDPLNHSTKATDPVPTPHSAPYDYITGPGGFTDMWLTWAPADQGWTSGLKSEYVDDPDASGFDHRIDMVFARARKGASITTDQGTVTGTDPADRDPATGLWPSDHGGVVLRLRGALS